MSTATLRNVPRTRKPATVTVLESELDALNARIAELEALNASLTAPRPAEVGEYKLVITTGIPTKTGNSWSSLEVTSPSGLLRRFFVNTLSHRSPRTDGALTTLIFASPMPRQ